MTNVLGQVKHRTAYYRRERYYVHRVLNGNDDLPCCPATGCSSPQVVSLAKKYQEGSLTAVDAGEQVVPPLNLLLQ